MVPLIIIVLLMIAVVLDATKIIDFTKKSGFLISGIIMPHIVLEAYLIWQNNLCTTFVFIIFSALLFLIYSYFFWRSHIVPFRGNKTDSKKVNVMYGGRNLISYGFWALFVNAAMYLIFINRIIDFCSESSNLVFFIIDLIYAFCTIYGLLLNGTLRIIILNRELGIYKRILIVLISPIPLINIIGLHYLSIKARDEYDYEIYRMTVNNTRISSDLCKTKYPIILVHGIGFKDLKWFNYWGRIPAELQKNGSMVCYGHQEPWGTILSNATELEKNINEFMQETNCEKVNIIAHSKGGLESRYAINELKMAPYVASLTTICTPHRGSELIPFLRKMPDGLYKFICRAMDKANKRNGDMHSDVYAASLELHPDFCKEFNEKYPDCPQVYYQSYTSTMKTMWGNSILCIPYAILKAVSSPVNDGLVCENSAKWGEYRGLFSPKGMKGISHGDMIDLQRKDIKGFDIVETYVKIVNDLKNKGF